MSGRRPIGLNNGPDDEAEQDEGNRGHEQREQSGDRAEDEHGQADNQKNREDSGTSRQSDRAHRQAHGQPEQLHEQAERQENRPEHQLQDEKDHPDDGKNRQPGDGQPGQSDEFQHLYPQKTSDPERRFQWPMADRAGSEIA